MGGLAESRTGSNKNIPKFRTHILIKLMCWPAQANFISCHHRQCLSLTLTHRRDMLAFAGYLKILLCLLWLYRHFASWAMSHRHCLLRQCRILLCLLWPYRYFTSRAICLLGYSVSWACLLGYFASWATLPLGLLCLLGYFASWATLPLGLASWATLPLGLASWAILPLGLLCLLGYFNMLPLGPCLIDIVCFDNAGKLVSLLGCAITGHLLVCQMISYVNMSNRDTL
jgi:hypothetical protein